MFTGIIEEIGEIRSIGRQDPVVVEISCSKILDDVNLGDSVAVNGICLTVKEILDNTLLFNVIQESIKTINFFSEAEQVNLERAATFNGRMGGHLVCGHVDLVGEIKNIKQEINNYLIEIKAAKEYMKYIIDKGSVAIDGISLTVQNKTSNSFTVGIIPHTLENTNLKNKSKGDSVNVEFDQIAKYTYNFANEEKKENKNRLRKFLMS